MSSRYNLKHLLLKGQKEDKNASQNRLQDAA